MSDTVRRKKGSFQCKHQLQGWGGLPLPRGHRGLAADGKSATAAEQESTDEPTKAGTGVVWFPVFGENS